MAITEEPAARADQGRFCPQCGHPTADAHFCPECGVAVDAAAGETPTATEEKRVFGRHRMAGRSKQEVEGDLRQSFDPSHIATLCEQFLYEGTPCDLRSLARGRQFVVAYIAAESPFADIPRSVEATVFSDTFRLSLNKVIDDYGAYDVASTFAAVIDISGATPAAAGALRMIDYQNDLGFKDVNDLVVDDPSNPWIAEIKDQYFAVGEAYEPSTAWSRLGIRACGKELVGRESLDIATHASAAAYRGQRGALDGVSMLFFHACVRYALATGKANLLAIFDLPPLANLQQFGDPFRTYEGLGPHSYGGPYDTLPAFCIIEEGMRRMREFNPAVCQVFVDGIGLKDIALLPSEYQPELHSDEAIAA
jgi:hypothetical protein